MTRIGRRNVITLAAMVTALVACRAPRVRSAGAPGGTMAPKPISMAALHQSGGVPPGWRFTVPRGDATVGRQLFVDFGCYTCHAVQGERFPSPPDDRLRPGPDLTGMGGYHPAAYFVESILDPNAVLVEGPGYIGPDGRSIMPAYPEMTLWQLTDVVAYLQSLRGDSTQHAHMHPTAASFLVEAAEVSADQFYAYDEWFDQHGAPDVKGVNGLVSLETYVARTRAGRLVISLFGFEDDVVLDDFVKRIDAASPADDLNPLLQVGTHPLFRSAPVYKAIGLSVP